jgi:hypothetical protein
MEIIDELKNLLFGIDSESKSKSDSICEYRIFDRMNVDDYNFTANLSNLKKMFNNITRSNRVLKIDDVTQLSPKLFIRDILTEYTVSNIFKIDSQNKLIHIMNKIMKSLYDEFYERTKIRLYFVYRGGNILKIYKNNFEAILPGRARKLFKREFDPYFKNSDIDFYTVVGEHKKFSKSKLLEINKYIQVMCYYGAYVARIFIMNNFDLFDYCRANTTALNLDFEYLLERINKDKENSSLSEVQEANFIGLGFNRYMFMKKGYNIDDILNLPPEFKSTQFVNNIDDISVFENYEKYGKSGRFDININTEEKSVNINTIPYHQNNLFHEDFSKYMDEMIDKNGILDYYITNNNKIYNQEEFIDFSLARLMINYVAVYERNGKYGLTNCSSELFDLSIGRPGDKMFDVYTEKSIVLKQFKYKNEKGEDLVDEIYIPNVDTTIIDIIKILFEYREFPWEDAKYAKRLYRLMILIFLNEFSDYTIPQILKILKSKKTRKYKSSEDTTFETLRYRNKELKKKIPKEYEREYEEYLNTYQEILDKLINIVSELKTFIEEDKQIQRKDIYRSLSR